MDTTEGTLVLSLARGRYTIGDPSEGPDLSSEQSIEVCIGGQWISGRVRYNSNPIYATQGTTKPRATGGYCVVLTGGGIVGLCVGMRVRTL